MELSNIQASNWRFVKALHISCDYFRRKISTHYYCNSTILEPGSFGITSSIETRVLEQIQYVIAITIKQGNSEYSSRFQGLKRRNNTFRATDSAFHGQLTDLNTKGALITFPTKLPIGSQKLILGRALASNIVSSFDVDVQLLAELRTIENHDTLPSCLNIIKMINKSGASIAHLYPFCSYRAQTLWLRKTS